MPLKSYMVRDNDTFAASTDLIDASTGLSVRELSIGIKAQQVAAAIIPENVAADILNPMEVRLSGSPIVSIRGSDLIALNMLAFRETPYKFRSAAVIANRTRIHGIKLHLNQPPREKGKLAYQFNYAAGANSGTITLSAAELATDEAPVGGFYHMVEVPHTLPAATGYGAKTSFAMPGDLLGVLIWNTTIEAAAADTQSCQSIKIFVGKDEQLERTASEMYELGAYARDNPAAAAVTTASWLDNYTWLNLMNDPIPQAADAQWQVNAGVASDPIRLIPLYRVGGAGA